MDLLLPWLRAAHALGVLPGGAGDAGPGGFAAPFLTFGLLIAIFYFLLIRPQQKQRKEGGPGDHQRAGRSEFHAGRSRGGRPQRGGRGGR